MPGGYSLIGAETSPVLVLCAALRKREAERPNGHGLRLLGRMTESDGTRGRVWEFVADFGEEGSDLATDPVGVGDEL